MSDTHLVKCAECPRYATCRVTLFCPIKQQNLIHITDEELAELELLEHDARATSQNDA